MVTFCRFAADETLSPIEMRALIAAGKIARTTLVQRSDSTEWKPAVEFDELKTAFEIAPKPPARPPKILKKFEAKFTETTEAPAGVAASPTLQLRFIGAWFVFVSTMAMFSGGPKWDDIGIVLAFGAFLIVGVALLIAPDRLRKSLRKHAD